LIRTLHYIHVFEVDNTIPILPIPKLPIVPKLPKLLIPIVSHSTLVPLGSSTLDPTLYSL